MNIDIFGIGDQFTQPQAIELLNSHVVRKGNEKKAKSTTECIGFVAGVLTLNDEIEVMIKFPNELIQLTKKDFYQQLTLLAMDF